jgi:hypothetical protein
MTVNITSDNGEQAGPGAGSASGSEQQTRRTRETRAINKYMELLVAQPGARTPQQVGKRVARLDEQIVESKAQGKWHMAARYTQKRIDLEEGASLEDAQIAFVAVVASYSENYEISYATWRQLGVSAGVLGAAGMR